MARGSLAGPARRYPPSGGARPRPLTQPRRTVCGARAVEMAIPASAVCADGHQTDHGGRRRRCERRLRARCRCLRGVTTGVRAACASRPKTDATRETRPPRAPAPNPTKNRMVYKVSTRVCVRVSRDLRRRAPTAYTCCTCDRVAPPRLPATMYSPVPVLRTGSRRRELDRREVESAERFARTLLPSQFSPAVLLTTT